VGALSPISKTLLADLCFVRSEGDGVLAPPPPPQQTISSGLELVPFVEGEPIPLNWSQALVEGGCGGSEKVGNAVELIMAFSQRRVKGVCENSLISFLRLIMREDLGVCLVAEAREGGIALSYEVQHPFLECKRAE
jgi:hypothetical protein